MMQAISYGLNYQISEALKIHLVGSLMLDLTAQNGAKPVAILTLFAGSKGFSHINRTSPITSTNLCAIYRFFHG